MLTESAEVSTLAARMTAVLHDLSRQPPAAEARDLARRFLAWMFQLGRLLELEPTLRDSAPVKEFLDSARGMPAKAVAAFGSVADGLEGQLHTIGDLEWRQISELRSALEFFEQYFGPHPEFELQEIDDTLRERAKYDGLKAPPPKGVPESHWWWTA